MMQSKFFQFVLALLTVVASFALHLEHLNKDLISMHVWRQTQTQSTITNFYEEDFNILNPKRNNRGNESGIFRMEFPLMQWLIAGVYHFTGPSILVTRICMWLFGLLATLGLFLLIHQITRNKIAAFCAAWFFTFSPSFFYFTINPLPDVFALAFGLIGLAAYFKYVNSKALKFLVIAGLTLSISTLVKLPFVVFFSLPAIHVLLTKWRMLTLLLAPMVAPLLWYAWVIPSWKGNGIVQGLLNSQISFATYLDYLQHNLISTLPESIIGYAALVFFLIGAALGLKKFSFKQALSLSFFGWTATLAVYLLFELNMIAKVHDYYLFPFYPLVFIAIAQGLIVALKHPKLKLLVAIALIAAPIACTLRLADRWNPEKPGFNPDFLTYKTELQNAVPNTSLVVVGNDVSQFILFYYINKKGWNFDYDLLNPEQLNSYILKGAQYLYTDSKTIQQSDQLKPYFKGVKAEFGSIQIIELQAIN